MEKIRGKILGPKIELIVGAKILKLNFLHLYLIKLFFNQYDCQPTAFVTSPTNLLLKSMFNTLHEKPEKAVVSLNHRGFGVIKTQV